MIVNKMYDKLRLAVQTNSPVFSEFLDLAEQKEIKNTLKIPFDIELMYYKGFKDDERKIIGFIPKSYFQIMNHEDILSLFPVQVIKVAPDYNDSKMFKHRDLLGSVLGLGLERKLFGDIIINGREAYILCHELGAKIILQELLQVGHMNVSTIPINNDNSINTLEPESKKIQLSVASLRIDGIVKGLANCSRNDSNALIAAGHVKLNQVEIQKVHQLVDVGDLISIRRHGKFKLYEIGKTSKKGRISLTFLEYI